MFNHYAKWFQLRSQQVEVINHIYIYCTRVFCFGPLKHHHSVCQQKNQKQTAHHTQHSHFKSNRNRRNKIKIKLSAYINRITNHLCPVKKIKAQANRHDCKQSSEYSI